MKKIVICISFLFTGIIIPQEIPSKWFYSTRKNGKISNLFTSYELKTDSKISYRKTSNSINIADYRPYPGAGSTQSELSIDVHPSDEKILLLSANISDWPFTTFYGAGPFHTNDGGMNWTGYTSPPYGINNGYPVSAIGGNGYFYQGYININRGQSIAVSMDKGNSWNTSLIASVPGPGDILDKNHLCIDKDNKSPYTGRLYAAWTRFQVGHDNNNDIEFVYSTDNGETWSFPGNISGGVKAVSHNQGVNIQTGKDGMLFCTWVIYDEWEDGSYGEDAIGFNSSSDGGVTWSTAKRIYAMKNFGLRGYLKTSGIRVASFPSMSINRITGEIYISWTQKGAPPAGYDPDIVLIKSTDNGETWSGPARVNDDQLNNGKDQYYNWSTVDQSTGYLHIIFYDSRNVDNDSAEVSMAWSEDGGKTFRNIKISDTVFSPKPIEGFNDGYQGDYIGVAALNNWVFPYWADDRTGNYQGWISVIRFLPEIIHEPVGNTDDLPGPYLVTMSIKSGLPLDRDNCRLYYWEGSSPMDSLPLLYAGNTRYYQYIPGKNSSATFNYFISVEDSGGGISRLPLQPDEYYSFSVMEDTEGPVIFHSPLKEQSYNSSLPEIKVTAKDQLGVENVSVEYRINGNPYRSFYLNFEGDNLWTGYFDTGSEQLIPGDIISYRIKAVDISTRKNVSFLPAEGTFKVNIISCKGRILVINDAVPSEGFSSADLISATLNEAGYSVDMVEFNSFEKNNLDIYDIIVLSAGTKTTGIFDDHIRRQAIIDYNIKGGRVFVEGGEVGWVYRYSSLLPEKDVLFRRTILKDSAWIADNGSGMIRKCLPWHIAFNFPNLIPDSVSLLGKDKTAEADIMHTMPNTPGIFKLAGWTNFPDSVGIITYSPTADSGNITNIFCTFSLESVSDKEICKKLIENLIGYMKFGYLFTPVNYISLRALTENNNVTIYWETVDETNNKGFEIERREDKNSFHTIEFIAGRGTLEGKFSYTFKDENLPPGKYSYRLKQIDHSGSHNYSEELSINIGFVLNFNLEQNFPNPFNSMTLIKFNLPVENNVNLSVYNLLGEKVLNIINEKLPPGEHKYKVNASSLSSGIYFYRLQAGDNMQVKKMILLK